MSQTQGLSLQNLNQQPNLELEEGMTAPEHNDRSRRDESVEDSENDVVPSLNNQTTVMTNNFFLAQGLS